MNNFHINNILYIASILFTSMLLISSDTDTSLISSTNLGLLIIPGLGHTNRLTTVTHNLRLLQPYLDHSLNIKLDCIIYVYTPRNDTTFWNNNNLYYLNYITKYCDIFDNPLHRVTDNLYSVHPLFIMNKYNFVFILLDDCKLLSDSNKGFESNNNNIFPLTNVLNIMIRNNLTVASPSVIGANVGGGQQFRTIMQREPQENTLGYISSFVEIFAWITSPKAYHCLWELLYPSINPYGWGYDFWYDRYCLDRVINHKMGIISVIKVKHEQDFSLKNNGRTDVASREEKWQALINQEKFYAKYLGINLKKYRESVRFINRSWNASVLGYLY